MTVATPAYKRILLKLSGEALMGDDAFGINRATIVRMVQEVTEVTRMGVEVAVVIGGGLLGLEAANGLMKQGMQVTVVHVLDTLMERQLDPVAADMLRAAARFAVARDA